MTLLDPIHGAARKRVCQRCAAGGLVVVSPRQAPVVKAIAPRAVGDDIARALRMLRTYAKASAVASGEAKGEDAAFHRGRAEGFEGAIQILARETP